MLTEKEISSIYDTYAQELYVYIRSFVHDQGAEDVLHDCFERLMRYSLDNDVDMTTVRPFLYAIARNRCIDLLGSGESRILPLGEREIRNGKSSPAANRPRQHPNAPCQDFFNPLPVCGAGPLNVLSPTPDSDMPGPKRIVAVWLAPVREMLPSIRTPFVTAA